MPVYKVGVTRLANVGAVISVDAKSEDDAEELAWRCLRIDDLIAWDDDDDWGRAEVYEVWEPISLAEFTPLDSIDPSFVAGYKHVSATVTVTVDLSKCVQGWVPADWSADQIEESLRRKAFDSWVAGSHGWMVQTFQPDVEAEVRLDAPAI
jgi:hypothetical protein